MSRERIIGKGSAPMAVVTSHAPGAFCWIELGTTDHNAAPTEIPGMGHFAIFADPQGAIFAIYRE